MKKTPIILILLIALFWLLVMPLAVGAYLRAWVPDWLDELGAGTRSQFESGWFQSQLTFIDALSVDLQARHFPPLGFRWIDLAGELTSPLSNQPFEVRGHLSLGGRSRLDLSGPDLRVTGEPQINAGPIQLQLDQQLNEPSTLALDLDQLLITDSLNNTLSTNHLAAALSWQALDDESLRLAVRLKATEPTQLGLQLAAEPVKRDALAALIEGLQQLNQAPPDSTAQQFAMLTIASAWQQMSEAGLVISLDELSTGPKGHFSGRWNTHTGQPVFHGQADHSSFLASLTPLVALGAKVRPDDAQRLLLAWLEALEERGWMTQTENTLLFSFGASE